MFHFSGEIPFLADSIRFAQAFFRASIYAQIIDDVKGITLCAASSADKDLEIAGKTKSEQATLVGEKIGKLATSKGIKNVVFDRGGYIYTGRVQALADGARSAGLEF